MKLPMRRTTASLLLSEIVLIAGHAVGQQNTLKEQLVGTWTVVSLINERDGKRTQPFGPNPKGYFMFDSSGHFSIISYVPTVPSSPTVTIQRRRRAKQSWRVRSPPLASTRSTKRIIQYSCKSSAAVSRPGTIPIRNASSLSREQR